MSSAIQIGIIGAGRIGIVHARTIAWRIPQAKVRGIADVRKDMALKTASELGIEKVTENYKDLLDDPMIDAVLVCSGTDTHARMVIEAASAGKHIFCEKPLDLTLEGVDEAINAVEKARVKLQVGFNRRFDPDFKRMREMIASGTIGKPYILRITSRDPCPPPIEYVKKSGGMFLDMTIHDFDMARFLMGCEVGEIHVTASNLIDPAVADAGDVDVAVVSLRFENGAVGTIDNSRRSVYGYDQRAEILGSKGMVHNHNHTPDSVFISDDQGIHSQLLMNFFLERYSAAFETEMRSFIESILQNKEPPVTGEDGRRALVLGYAALKSVREGRPVKIREI
jgi:myo-inositol 2-dehydrogenase/D-chiro-inositol 1-dehydrogenase